jgi:hypothetical protein
MEYAKKDLVWPLEQYPSGRFRTHHDVCQYPIGTMDGKDIFCGRDAIREIEGYLFCSLHAPMAERGCLDIEYTDGTTPREIIESAEQEQA